mmetsp:Transcript_23015/g.25565  ORF Transcript_23015/g.25565 Transcript_23015/m.25565 type:complete len:211 (+) Transcript_23015:243-875(+)
MVVVHRRTNRRRRHSERDGPVGHSTEDTTGGRGNVGPWARRLVGVVHNFAGRWVDGISIGQKVHQGSLSFRRALSVFVNHHSTLDAITNSLAHNLVGSIGVPEVRRVLVNTKGPFLPRVHCDDHQSSLPPTLREMGVDELLRFQHQVPAVSLEYLSPGDRRSRLHAVPRHEDLRHRLVHGAGRRATDHVLLQEGLKDRGHFVVSDLDAVL